MKWLIRIAIVFGVMILALVVIGLLLDKSYTIERSVVIDASPAEVHAHVGDLRQWAAWEPWRQADPELEIELGERTSGVGASQHWSDQSGGGRLVFTASDPATGIAYDLFFGEDEAMRASSTMRYAVVEGGTEVTWTMSGEIPDPIFGGFLVLLFDDALEAMFADGLARLELAVEGVEADVPDGAPSQTAPLERPVAVGDELPSLTLRDIEGEPVDLAARIAEQPAVLVFYRGGWCPYCNAHLAELGAGHQQIAEAGWQVIGISPDRPEEVATTATEQELPYTLLSDADASAIRALGLAFTVDPATRETYAGYGIDLEAASGHDHYQLPHPAVLLVDREGVIRFVHHDEDYKQRLSLDEIMSAIQATATAP